MCGLNFQVGYQDRLRVNLDADEALAQRFSNGAPQGLAIGAPHLHFVNLRPVFCTILYFREFIKSDTMAILKLQDIRNCNYYSHILGTKPFSWHAALHE